MPTIPGTEIRERAPQFRPGQVLPGAGAFVGRGLDTVSQALQNVVDGAEAAEKTKLAGQASAAFNRRLQEIELGTTDPEEFKGQSAEAIQEVYDNAISSASNNRVRQAVTAALANNLEDAKRRAEAGYFTKKRDKGIADFTEARQTLLDAAVTSKGENLEGVYRMYGELLGSLRTNNYITEQEKAGEAQKFISQVELNTAYDKADRTPGALLDELEGGAYRNLTGPQRQAVKNHAEARLGEQKQKDREIKQAAKNDVENELLRMLNGNTLTVPKIESVDPQLVSPDEKYQWQERLRAKQERLKRESAEPDPFKKSDSRVFALVMKGITENPLDWSAAEINKYVGKGLSSSDALTLDNARRVRANEAKEKKEKGESGKLSNTPLARAVKSLDQLQNRFVFLSPELTASERAENITVEQAALNNERADAIRQQLLQRGETEDPFTVLNELMQPYYEERTKGWLESLTFGAFGGNQGRDQLRIKARQILARERKEITEENIDKVVEVLERGVAPEY